MLRLQLREYSLVIGRLVIEGFADAQHLSLAVCSRLRISCCTRMRSLTARCESIK